jgi:hypothetical protein
LGCGTRDEAADRVANAHGAGVVDENGLPELPDIRDGKQHAFLEQGGVATVLIFTMQDCPIANSYIPTLNKLAEEFGPRGVRWLLVHVDPQITIEQARTHAGEYEIKAPVVIDRQHAWVNRAGATRSPEAAVFSPSGEMLYSGRIDDRYVDFGKRRTHVSAHDLRDAIEAVLAGQPVSQPKTESIGCFIPALVSGE